LRRPGSPPATTTVSTWRSTDPRAALRFDVESLNELYFYDARVAVARAHHRVRTLVRPRVPRLPRGDRGEDGSGAFFRHRPAGAAGVGRCRGKRCGRRSLDQRRSMRTDRTRRASSADRDIVIRCQLTARGSPGSKGCSSLPRVGQGGGPVAPGAMACPVETVAASSREPPAESSVRVDLVVRLVVFRRESCCCARSISRSSVLRVRGSEASGIRRKYVLA
jgi:hypothetical protein